MTQRPKISGYVRILPPLEDGHGRLMNPCNGALHDIRKISSSQLTIPAAQQNDPRQAAMTARASSSSFTRQLHMVEPRRLGTSAGAQSGGAAGKRPMLSCQAVIGPNETDDMLYAEVIDWYLSLLYNGEDLHILAFSGSSPGLSSCIMPEATRFFFCSSSRIEKCFIARLLHCISAKAPDTLFTISCRVMGYQGSSEPVYLMPQQYITPAALLKTYCALLIGVGATMPTITTLNITMCDSSGSFVVTSTLKLAVVPLVGNNTVLNTKSVLEEAVGGKGQFPKATCAAKEPGNQGPEPPLAQKIKERKCSRAERLGDIQVLDCTQTGPGQNTAMNAVDVPCSTVNTCANCNQVMADIGTAFTEAHNRAVPLLKSPFLQDIKGTFTGRVCTCMLGFVYENAGRDMWTRRILGTVAKAAFTARNNGWAGPTTEPRSVEIDADELKMLKDAAERARFLETELQMLKHESQQFVAASGLDLASLKTRTNALATSEAIMRAERAHLAQQGKILADQVRTYEILQSNVVNHCSCGSACNSLATCTCGCSRKRACSSHRS